MGIAYTNQLGLNRPSPFYTPSYYSEDEGTYKPGVFVDTSEYYQENVREYYGSYDGVYARGKDVVALQNWLNMTVRKYGGKLKVDGIYGEQTRAAVRELQQFLTYTLRIPVKIDGLYGCQTYNAVLKALSRTGWPPPPPPPAPFNRGCGSVTYSPTISKPPATTPLSALPNKVSISSTGGGLLDKAISWLGSALNTIKWSFARHVVRRGPAVVRLQQWLNTIPFGPPIRVDGAYGPETSKKVLQIQGYIRARFNEPIKLDGLYGCETYNAIMKHLKELGWAPPPPPLWGRCAAAVSAGSATVTTTSVGGRMSSKLPYPTKPLPTSIVASGPRVIALQKWLNAVLPPKIKVDGLYGPQTAAKVAQVQAYINQRFGERITVDGLYGCETYGAIMRHLSQLGWPRPPATIFGNCGATSTGGTGGSTGGGNTGSQTRVEERVIIKEKDDDEIFGIKKEYVFIGGAMAFGLLALMLASRGD